RDDRGEARRHPALVTGATPGSARTPCIAGLPTLCGHVRVSDPGRGPAGHVWARHVQAFRAAADGNPLNMIGLALALIVLGVIFMFTIPWGVGIVVGAVGIILLVLYAIGFGRSARAEHRL